MEDFPRMARLHAWERKEAGGNFADLEGEAALLPCLDQCWSDLLEDSALARVASLRLQCMIRSPPTPLLPSAERPSL